MSDVNKDLDLLLAGGLLSVEPIQAVSPRSRSSTTGSSSSKKEKKSHDHHHHHHSSKSPRKKGKHSEDSSETSDAVAAVDDEVFKFIDVQIENAKESLVKAAAAKDTAKCVKLSKKIEVLEARRATLESITEPDDSNGSSTSDKDKLDKFLKEKQKSKDKSRDKKERKDKDSSSSKDKRDKDKERKEKERRDREKKEKEKEKRRREKEKREKEKDLLSPRIVKGTGPPPTPPSDPSSDYAVALHDYDAENPGELSLRRNDVVIVRETRGEWWRGLNAHGKKGWFPAMRVGPATPEQAKQLAKALSRLKKKPSSRMVNEGRTPPPGADIDEPNEPEVFKPDTMVLGDAEMRELIRIQAELEREGDQTIKAAPPTAPKARSPTYDSLPKPTPPVATSPPRTAPPVAPSDAANRPRLAVPARAPGAGQFATSPRSLQSTAPPPASTGTSGGGSKVDLRSAVAQARNLAGNKGMAPVVSKPATVAKPATAPPPRQPPTRAATVGRNGGLRRAPASGDLAVRPSASPPRVPPVGGSLRSPRGAFSPAPNAASISTTNNNNNNNNNNNSNNNKNSNSLSTPSTGPPPVVSPRQAPPSMPPARKTPPAIVTTPARGPPPLVPPTRTAASPTPPPTANRPSLTPAASSSGPPPLVSPRNTNNNNTTTTSNADNNDSRKAELQRDIDRLRDEIKVAGEKEDFERALELRKQLTDAESKLKELDASSNNNSNDNSGNTAPAANDDDDDDDDFAIDLHPSGDANNTLPPGRTPPGPPPGAPPSLSPPPRIEQGPPPVATSAASPPPATTMSPPRSPRKDTGTAVSAQSDAEKDAIARMMAAQQAYVTSKASEEPTKKEEKKGFFKKMFSKGKEDEPEMVGKEISVVMSVEHVAHAGYDAKKGGFDTRNLPKELQALFDSVEQSLASMGASGVTADEAKEILKMAAQDPSIVGGGASSPISPRANGGATSPGPSSPRNDKKLAKEKEKAEKAEKKAAAAAAKKEPKSDTAPIVAAAPPPPPPPPGKLASATVKAKAGGSTVAPPPMPAGGGGGGGAEKPVSGQPGDLLSAIRAGTSLKKVDKSEQKLPGSGGGAGPGGNIGDVIARALVARRGALAGNAKPKQDDDDDDDDWD